MNDKVELSGYFRDLYEIIRLRVKEDKHTIEEVETFIQFLQAYVKTQKQETSNDT